MHMTDVKTSKISRFAKTSTFTCNILMMWRARNLARIMKINSQGMVFEIIVCPRVQI